MLTSKIRLSFVVLGCVVVLMSGKVNARMAETGYAKFSELNQELFLVSIIGGADEFAESVQANAKRIEFKFLANYSHRRFNKLLVQSAAINNSSASLSRNAGNLTAFTQQIKGRFSRGDHLIIEERDEGITCLLNGAELGEISSNELFDILLNVWVGPVPPSREFKESLLGKIDNQELEIVFDSLTFSESRKNLANEWGSRSVALASQVAVNLENEARKADEAQAIEIALAEQSLREKNTAPEQRVQTKPASRVSQNVNAKKGSGAAKPPVEQISKQALEYELKQQLEEQAQVNEMVKQYASSLAYRTKTKISYPKTSMRLGQTGSVMALVTIDRVGNVVDVQFATKAKYKLLNKAVEAGIEESAPYPGIPGSITGETFTFVVPVAFALQS